VLQAFRADAQAPEDRAWVLGARAIRSWDAEHSTHSRDDATVPQNPELRAKLREQITASDPVVVALFICPKDEAERYRAGAEAFIDRIFFQEEVRECIEYLKATIERCESR